MVIPSFHIPAQPFQGHAGMLDLFHHVVFQDAFQEFVRFNINPLIIPVYGFNLFPEAVQGLGQASGFFAKFLGRFVIIAHNVLNFKYVKSCK